MSVSLSNPSTGPATPQDYSGLYPANMQGVTPNVNTYSDSGHPTVVLSGTNAQATGTLDTTLTNEIAAGRSPTAVIADPMHPGQGLATSGLTTIIAY